MHHILHALHSLQTNALDKQRRKDQKNGCNKPSSRRHDAAYLPLSRGAAALLVPHALNDVRDPLEEVADGEALGQGAVRGSDAVNGGRRGRERLVERARRDDAAPVGGEVEGGATSGGRDGTGERAADGRRLRRARRHYGLQRAEAVGGGVGGADRGDRGAGARGLLGASRGRDGADGGGDGDDVGDDGDGLRARGAVCDAGGARRDSADRRGVDGRRRVGGRDGGRRRKDGRVVRRAGGNGRCQNLRDDLDAAVASCVGAGAGARGARCALGGGGGLGDVDGRDGRLGSLDDGEDGRLGLETCQYCQISGNFLYGGTLLPLTEATAGEAPAPEPWPKEP